MQIPSLKSGIKERVSDTVLNKLAYAHSGLPYEHTRQGSIGFYDLDYAMFVQGELGIILDPSMHSLAGEAQGRLQLLRKISNMYRIYEWQAIKDFYASVLHKLERGSVSWDNINLATMELEIMSRANLKPAPSSFRPPNRFPGQNRINVGPTPAPHSTQTNTTNQGPSHYFCANFQKGRCLKESPHPGMIKGTEVMLQHICSKCLLHGKKIAYHPETSPLCPLAWPKITQVQNPQVRLNSQLALSQVIRANTLISASGRPNYAGLRIPHPSKFDLKFLDDHLTRHEDRFIVECLKFGCPIGLNRDKVLTKLPFSNHKGAMQHPAAIDKYLETELSQGSCIGPFKRNPFTQKCHTSPLNTVDKRDSIDRRVIVDLSYPKWANSVNNAIDLGVIADADVTLKYPTIDALTELVVENGRGCALFKSDLKSAYRQLPVDFGDIHVLGYKWKDLLYFDTTLPMGLSSAAFYCQKVTNFIRHIYEDKGFRAVNYLDDFGSATMWEKAHNAHAVLKDLIRSSGLVDSVDKEVPPTCVMIFLGILFNSTEFTLSIDQSRLEEIRSLLEEWLAKNKGSKKDLQSLLGKLQFVASCVRPGRVFTMRLLALLRQIPNNGFVSIPEETRADLRWWRCFMEKYNGISMMPDSPWSEPDQVFATDACLEGCGGWCSGNFFHGATPAY